MAALQLEISGFKKREAELVSKANHLDERLRAMTESHQDAIVVSDSLNLDLKEERRKTIELENHIKRINMSKQENDEVNFHFCILSIKIFTHKKIAISNYR